MHSFIDIFAYKIYKEKLLSHSDIRKMKYGMTFIWNEMIKLILLLIFFSILDKLYVFLFCIGLLLPIRIFSGGLHFKSGKTCFIMSLSFFCLSIFLLPYILSMTLDLAYILMFISTLVIFIYSPIASPFRPIQNKKRKRILKYLSLFFTLLCHFILFKFIFIYNKIFFECGLWTICLQAFQLFLAKGGYHK